ncbi:MAG: hypothetical protein GWP08_15910, partial [Nitrospiraceae bacterium]|nr:hypothetical protein [Nitrospiraceae bacterium]
MQRPITRVRHTATLTLLALAAAACFAEPPSPYTNRVFPKGPPPAETIDVVDLLSADPDTKLAAITLQGLVNGGETTRVYLRLFERQDFWLEETVRRNYIQETHPLSLDDYWTKYAARAKAVVVYDPGLPATINIATMISAVDHGFVVAPDMLGRFADGREVVDLRGRWRSNVEAYTWAFDNLWPRMNHRLLAVYHPTHTNHHLRDYLIQNKTFTFWVTGPKAAKAPFADHAKEKAFAEMLLAATKPNVPIIGWWDAAQLDEGMTEYGGVGWAGRYGKWTIASNWQDNLSFHSGIPIDMATALARFRQRPTLPAPALDPDKVYLSFVVMESGDAPSYWPHVQKQVWADPKRGDIPIGWSFGPAVIEMLPLATEWFLEQATPNDYFFMALSGAGYVHPYRELMTQTPDPEAAWREYLDLTGDYMRLLGIRDLGLYTDAWRPFDRARQDTVTRRFAEGIPHLRNLILGMGRDEGITRTTPHYRLGSDDVLVSHVFTR